MYKTCTGYYKYHGGCHTVKCRYAKSIQVYGHAWSDSTHDLQYAIGIAELEFPLGPHPGQ